MASLSKCEILLFFNGMLSYYQYILPVSQNTSYTLFLPPFLIHMEMSSTMPTLLKYYFYEWDQIMLNQWSMPISHLCLHLSQLLYVCDLSATQRRRWICLHGLQRRKQHGMTCTDDCANMFFCHSLLHEYTDTIIVSLCSLLFSIIQKLHVCTYIHFYLIHCPCSIVCTSNWVYLCMYIVRTTGHHIEHVVYWLTFERSHAGTSPKQADMLLYISPDRPTSPAHSVWHSVTLVLACDW